jgi:hypothetical protein
MLDSSIAHTGVAGEAVGKAAQRTAAASAAAAQADTSAFRKFTGLLMDVVLIGGLGYGVVTGACYLRYGTEVRDDRHWVLAGEWIMGCVCTGRQRQQWVSVATAVMARRSNPTGSIVQPAHTLGSTS